MGLAGSRGIVGLPGQRGERGFPGLPGPSVSAHVNTVYSVIYIYVHIKLPFVFGQVKSV